MSKLPFSEEKLREIIKSNPTPVYVYEEKGILETANKLNKMFEWSEGYINFYASKALPNPYIHKLLYTKAGMGIDASSMAELVLAEKVGYEGRKIMLTSNDTPADEFRKAKDLGANINFDDIDLIDYFTQKVGALPELVCFRYNPGDMRTSGGNDLIGNPADAKYGLTKEQISDAYKIAKSAGSKRFGLHTMVVSSELSIEAHEETAIMMFELAAEIEDEAGIKFEFINLGGGYGIPYNPGESELDTETLGKLIEAKYKTVFDSRDNKPRIATEHGRYVTGAHGYLVLSVRHLKNTYKNYVGTDGSMANLMRPGMYGAYHEITVLGKEDLDSDHVYDVVGSLCENNDKFAIDRKLPEINVEDILVIHNAGAHGHAMGFNYNGKLRSAEVLLKEDGNFKQIRRAETLDDHFATLDFKQL